jgi:hypothetical protein
LLLRKALAHFASLYSTLGAIYAIVLHQNESKSASAREYFIVEPRSRIIDAGGSAFVAIGDRPVGNSYSLRRRRCACAESPPRADGARQFWRFVMLQRERPRGVRLGIEVEADALLLTSGMQAYSIALKRAEEASSDEMARGWSFVAATIARRSGRRASLLDALFG